jgi:hypothetical protein
LLVRNQKLPKLKRKKGAKNFQQAKSVNLGPPKLTYSLKGMHRNFCINLFQEIKTVTVVLDKRVRNTL